MFPKVLKWLALVAVAGLIICCYLPWVHIMDNRINESFTGFYSFQNQYGKPGVLIVPLAIVIGIFILLNKVWAKRANLFIAALLLGYVIKSYVSFTSCYSIYCPVKQPAVYLMLLFSVIILAGAIFPEMKMKQANK